MSIVSTSAYRTREEMLETITKRAETLYSTNNFGLSILIDELRTLKKYITDESLFKGTLVNGTRTGKCLTVSKSTLSAEKASFEKGQKTGRVSETTKQYHLIRKESSPASGEKDKQLATLYHYNMKLKFEGKVLDGASKQLDFEVHKILSDRFTWELLKPAKFNAQHIEGEAFMKFSNGELTCFTINGMIALKSTFMAALTVNGAKYFVEYITQKGLVGVLGGKVYRIEIDRNVIEPV